MSEFTNKSTDAKASSDRYIAGLLGMLGDRDPFAVLASTPARLRQLAEGLTEEQIRRPEREGKWSILNVMEHLADTELVVSNRIRFPVADDGVGVIAFDQDAWVASLWKHPTVDDVLFQQEAARRINLRFLRELTDEDMERATMHPERGRETVRQIMRLAAGHDLVHLRQIERIRAAVT